MPLALYAEASVLSCLHDKQSSELLLAFERVASGAHTSVT